MYIDILGKVVCLFVCKGWSRNNCICNWKVWLLGVTSYFIILKKMVFLLIVVYGIILGDSLLYFELVFVWQLNKIGVWFTTT